MREMYIFPRARIGSTGLGGPGMHATAQYSWSIGMGLGFGVYLGLVPRFRVAALSRVDEPGRRRPGHPAGRGHRADGPGLHREPR